VERREATSILRVIREKVEDIAGLEVGIDAERDKCGGKRCCKY